MRLTRIRWTVLTAGLAAAVLAAGCGNGAYEDEGVYEDGAGVYENEELGADEGVGADALGTTGAGYGVYDAEITPFLDRYYRDFDVFADDDLDFTARDGVVSITGEVDTVAERDRLVGWANDVPGVRDVDASALTIAE